MVCFCVSESIFNQNPLYKLTNKGAINVVMFKVPYMVVKCFS